MRRRRRSLRASFAAPPPPRGLEARRFGSGDADIALLWFPLLQGLATAERMTEAEHHVVDAVLGGKSNADIARERGTSARTVANQVASVFRKLGVHSRGELTALAPLLCGRLATRADDKN